MLGYSGGDKSMGIYKNNIAFGGTATGSGPGTQAVNNSWNLAAAPAESDFASVDTAGISGPRQADGSLPELKFMRLAGSKYVDKGVDVGLAFRGTAPDLGAFETGEPSGIAIGPGRKKARLGADLRAEEGRTLQGYDFSGRLVSPGIDAAAKLPILYLERD